MIIYNAWHRRALFFRIHQVTIPSSTYSWRLRVMPQANLSETLFKPRFKHPETSTLVRRLTHSKQSPVESTLDGNNAPHWYRMINRLMWIWRGVDPKEILDVQARIAMSTAEHTDPELYDTVVGYRGGNWIYEWSTQAMQWQQKASQEQDTTLSGQHWLHASNLYSIAAYPHIKGDVLAEQAQALANRAYEEAAQRLPGTMKEMEFAIPGGSPVIGFCICPKGRAFSHRPDVRRAGWPAKRLLQPV
jgi:esterase FrsA